MGNSIHDRENSRCEGPEEGRGKVCWNELRKGRRHGGSEKKCERRQKPDYPGLYGLGLGLGLYPEGARPLRGGF